MPRLGVGMRNAIRTYPFFIWLICCAPQISVKNDLHGLRVPAQGSMMQSSPAIVVTVEELRKDMCIPLTDEMWDGIPPLTGRSYDKENAI